MKHIQVLLHQETQNMNLQSSLTAAWDWSKKWDLPIKPAKCNYLTIGRNGPLRSPFPDGSGTPMPISKLVNDTVIQADVFSFQDLTNSTFIPFYGALVRPHFEYGMLACSPKHVADKC